MSMDPDPPRPAYDPAPAASSYGSTGGDAGSQGLVPSGAEAAPQTPTHPVGPTNGFAIASLVLGIIGLMGFPPVIPSILGLIFGYKAKREIDASNGYEQGRGMAVAGIVLSWVAIAMGILVLLFFAVTAVGLGVFQELGP